MDATELKSFFSQTTPYSVNELVLPGEMSPRERFFAIMDFRKPDRIIDTEFGYWAGTLKRWHDEGLPVEVDNNTKADLFFGFDRWQRGLWITSGILPAFEPEIIERNDTHTVKYDERRIKCQVFTDGSDTIPHYLDFPIKDRETYAPFKERFLPKLHERIPQDIARIGNDVKNRNYILSLHAGSAAGIIRDLMGFEGFSIATCIQPDLIAEILTDLSDLYHSVAVELSKHLSLDLILWWEDIAFKTGPIVSPEWFSSMCGPVYKRALDIYRTRGNRFSYVDCDGDNRLLVPTWLDNHVNIIFPLEVNAGVHPHALRQRFESVRMMGGVDKTVLIQGPEAIRKELLRLKPLADEGGFIPHVDHRVQSDVSYKDYLYYLEAKRDIFGISNKVLAV